MSLKVLVTGAGGYIGSVLCPKLSEHGYQVIAMDLPGRMTFTFSEMTYVEGNVLDSELLKKYVSQADVLIPLAAIVGAPACEKFPELARRVNFESVQTLNRLRSKDQLVLFPMTNNGYAPEPDQTEVTEKTPFKTDSLYTRSKYDAEQALLASGNAISFRLASLFGHSPQMRWDLLLHHFVQEAWNTKKLVLYEADFKRNFVSLQDVVNCFIHAIRNASLMKNQIYNVALEGANLSKRDLAHRIQQFLPDLILENTEGIHDPDGRNFFISTEKIKKTGFHAQHSLEEGIQEILRVCQNTFSKMVAAV